MSNEVKLIVNRETVVKWQDRQSECSNTIYNRIRNRLFTIVEIILPDDSQLKALKSCIEDICEEMYRVIDYTQYTMLENYFSISEKPEEKKYSPKVNEFWYNLCKLHRQCFKTLSRIVVNLATLAVEDIKRQKILEIEVERLIDFSSYELQDQLKEGITEFFGLRSTASSAYVI